MKTLNKRSTEIFLKIVEGVDAEHPAKHINNNLAYMKVSVDFVADTPHGKMYAIAHNFVQNGDLMADPDMQFIVMKGFVVPMTYQLDALGVFTEAAFIDENNQFKFRPKAQADITLFANTWMKNIHQQQGI